MSDELQGPIPIEAARTVGSSCFCFHLRRAARLVTQSYNEALRPLDLQATQFTLLMAIRGLGPVSMQHLAERVGMDRTTLTRNLRILSERAWVEVEPGDDRRVREVSLSDAGHDVLLRAYPLWHEAQATLGERLGGAEASRLLAELVRTTDAVLDILQTE